MFTRTEFNLACISSGNLYYPLIGEFPQLGKKLGKVVAAGGEKFHTLLIDVPHTTIY